MGRRNAKQIVDAVRDELLEIGIVLGHGTELDRGLLSELSRHFEMRDLWESSASGGLPPTDVGDRALSIPEFLRIAHDDAFALRRASDGLTASRPIAVDAIELTRRGSAALRAMVGSDGNTEVPKRLRVPASVVAWGVFELARSLVGYLANHFAPDVTLGRDAPDAWLSHAETSAARAATIAELALAHRVMERLRKRSDEIAVRDRASMFSQRVTAVFQAASVETPHDGLADYVRSRHWLEPLEIEAARTSIDAANQLPNEPAHAELAIASAMLNIIEGRPGDLATELRNAAEHLEGINRVGVLRSVIELVSEPEVRADVADTLLAETAPGTSAGAFTLRVQSLQQLLEATASIALVDPSRAAMLARRIADLPHTHTFGHHHVWLIPGRTPVALIEWQSTEPEAVPLPNLNDLGMMETLILRHAEEFQHDFDPGRLRQQLSRIIDPLRTALSAATDQVTFQAFGWLKHVPLASLTGRGSILAINPGVHLFAAGPSEHATDLRRKRLYIVDEELRDHHPRIADDAEVARFDSRQDGADAKEILQSAFATPDVSELVFFGHGHVDQFYVMLAGLIVGETHDGNGDLCPILVPSVVLANLDLRSVEMALVMACGAGQGNVFVEPSLSVGHAFRRAGARRVIAPQWPIVATDALAFTRRYLELIEQGRSYQEAWARVLAEDPARFMSIALLTS